MENKNRFVLAFDTTTLGTSVSIASKDGEILKTKYKAEKDNRASYLFTLIDECIIELGVKLYDIDLICVAVGPGSYTGMRLGLAVAKSVSINLGIKAVSVNTLKALAYKTAYSENRKICAILPAGRNDLFAQVFELEGQVIIEVTDQKVVSIERLISDLLPFSSIIFAGVFSDSLVEQIGDIALKNKIDLNVKSNFNNTSHNDKGWSLIQQSSPLSESVAKLGLETFLSNKGNITNSLLANYVRKTFY